MTTEEYNPATHDDMMAILEATQSNTAVLGRIEALLQQRPLTAPAAAAVVSGKKPRRSKEEIAAAKAEKDAKPKRPMSSWTAYYQALCKQLVKGATNPMMTAYEAWLVNPATPDELAAKHEKKIEEAKTEAAKEKLRAKGVSAPDKMGFAGHLKDTEDAFFVNFTKDFAAKKAAAPPSPAAAAAAAPAAAKPVAKVVAKPAATAAPAAATGAPKAATAAKGKAAKKPDTTGYKSIVHEGTAYWWQDATGQLYSRGPDGGVGDFVGDYDMTSQTLTYPEEELEE